LSNKKNLQDSRPKILRPKRDNTLWDFGKRKRTLFASYDNHFIMLNKEFKDKKS